MMPEYVGINVDMHIYVLFVYFSAHECAIDLPHEILKFHNGPKIGREKIDGEKKSSNSRVVTPRNLKCIPKMMIWKR